MTSSMMAPLSAFAAEQQDSTVSAAENVDAGLLSSLSAALYDIFYDIWLEAAIVALVIHFYVMFARSTPGMLQRCVGSKKVAARGLPETPQAKCRLSASGAVGSGTATGAGAFVASVLQKKGKDLLQQYETFVREQRVDLRQYIADDQIARAFYWTLLEHGVQAAAEWGDADQGCSGHSARATTSRLLADMRTFSFERSREFYSGLLKLHTVYRLFADCQWLVDVMVADGISIDRTMYGYLLSAAVACGEDKRALSIFKELLQLGPVPMRTYMTVLRVHVKSQDWAAAVEILEGMKVHDVRPDALVLNTVLRLCVSSGVVVTVERVFAEWASSIDVVSCNTVLKAYVQQVNLAKAESLLKRMMEKGPAPNLISFNTIMDCVARHVQQSLEQGSSESRALQATGVARRQWQLLDMLVGLGLEPDRYTCSTLVKSLHLAGGSADGIDQVVALLQKLGPAGLHQMSASTSNEPSPTRLQEVLFNTLLDVCAGLRDLDRMGKIFQMMRSFQVEPSSVTFGTLIKAFGQERHIERCHTTWKSMQDAKVKPTVITFGCYIDMCVRNADLATAERVFRSMVDSGVKPNVVIFMSMIRGYAQARKARKALQLYKELQREGLGATAATFNSILDIIVRELTDPAALREIMDDMHKGAVAPDVVTYSILIKANCNAGQLESAVSLFRQLRSSGLAFDEVAFNTLLLACSKADRLAEAEEILGEMRAIHMAPTHVTISIVVKMYGKAKMLDKAIELSETTEREYGLKPNLHVYTCLIQACVRSKQVRKSWMLFGEMLLAGVTPDAVTYGTVIQGCVYHHKFVEAMALVRHAHVKEDPGSPCILRNLGLLELCERDNFTVAALRREQPAILQADVLKALLAGLKRKGLPDFVAEVEATMAAHGGGGAQALHLRKPCSRNEHSNRFS